MTNKAMSSKGNEGTPLGDRPLGGKMEDECTHMADGDTRVEEVDGDVGAPL